MPDVGVKLNIEADYRAALDAVGNLGKALEAVQQKAKLVLPGGAGGQPGAGGDVAVPDTAEQQKNMQALAQAVAMAAKAAEMLAAAMERLSPALKDMGPGAEQVQQVAALGQHYKELAQSLSVAAEAAKRYKAADGGMKETDERINKLVAENAALMDRLSAVQAEYMAMVQGNAERERERVLREANVQAVEKEKVATTDETYQMQLATMSKRQLVEEIRRLAQARKAAAAAGNEYDYKAYGEYLKIARQELRKMNQEQQVNKIAFLQQAQVAQQMGANLRTITDGVMNFSESMENGTLNLTGMASAVISLSMAIKAGLGPLGWALAAVEALTLAWNWYAKSQQEAKKADEEREKKARDLATAFNDAAEAVNALAEKEAELGKLEDLKRAYAGLNEELRERNKLLDDSLRKLSAELAMRAKEEDFERTLKKNAIMRDFWSGAIDEEERDRRLDALNVEAAEQKRRRTMEKARAEEKVAQDKEQAELDRLGAATGLRERLRMEKNDKFSLTPEEVEREYANLLQAENQLKRRQKERDELQEKINFQMRVAQNPFHAQGAFKKIEQYQAMLEGIDLAPLENNYQKAKDRLKGINLDDVESGLYKEQYEALQQRLRMAITEADEAETAYNEAKADVLAKRGEVELADAQTRQDVRIAQGTSDANAVQRKAEAEYKAAQQQKKEAERLRKQAEAEARRAQRERDRINALGTEARVEGLSEGRALRKDIRRFTKGGAYDLLEGGINQQEAERMVAAMEFAAKNNNESLMKMINAVLDLAKSMGMTSESVLGYVQRESNKLKNQVENALSQTKQDMKRIKRQQS